MRSVTASEAVEALHEAAHWDETPTHGDDDSRWTCCDDYGPPVAAADVTEAWAIDLAFERLLSARTPVQAEQEWRPCLETRWQITARCPSCGITRTWTLGPGSRSEWAVIEITP